MQKQHFNNINQVAIHDNSYGVYPDEIAGLWGCINNILKQLAKIVEG